uniref:Zinc finger, CCHC-type n=1 Tax=Tanacetum cinerariifolium TaxID=118510 RepID=A0A6L2MWM8_TANCI|nr:zinc finger, CCHC-type [Tanacetum cinerariifolium]
MPYYPNFQPQYSSQEEQILFAQFKKQMQMNQFSQQQQQQSNQATGSQLQSDHQSFNLLDETEDENEEEPIPTPTSKKTSRGPRLKAKAKKTKTLNHKSKSRNDPKTGCDQQKDTFWYKILDVYNIEAKKRKFVERSKNMLTGKENDEDWMTRVQILYKPDMGSDFKHKSAWLFLKNKHKWTYPESTNARRYRFRVIDDDPEHFGDDALPRPPELQRLAKSQRSGSNSRVQIKIQASKVAECCIVLFDDLVGDASKAYPVLIAILKSIRTNVVKMQMQMNQISQQQQQSNQATGSQPQSDHQSFNLLDETEDENEEEPIPTSTSKKTSHGPRLKDPKMGYDQQKYTFWYKILDVYNTEAEKRKFVERTKNMLTGKWTPMNVVVQKFNQLVTETLVHSGKNDEYWMTRVQILYKTRMGSDFKHKSAWLFLKNKHKWTNPESTNARRYRFCVTDENPEHFGDDALPRPPGLQRLAKSQRSGSNSNASSGSNPIAYQEFMVEQYELDHKAKMQVIEQSEDRRPKAVDPISKDCGGHDFNKSTHTRWIRPTPLSSTPKMHESDRHIHYQQTNRRHDTTTSTYLVNRSPSSAIGLKKPVDMLGSFGSLASIKQGILEPVVPYRNMGFNESGEYKKTFIGSDVRDGLQELQTQDLIDYQLARDMEQYLACELFGYREDSNEAAFAVAALEKIYAHEPLTFNNTVAWEAISNGDSDGYYWGIHQIWATKGLLDKAKGNVLGKKIVKDQSGYTLRVSQSRFYNGKLVQTLLEGHSILSLEGSLSGDCDVEKNGKWSCIYAVGSQEYQMVCTILDIASADVGYGLMILGCAGSLKANLQYMEALSTTEAGYMTFTKD